MTHDRISLTPGVVMGKPVIAGTRIPIDLLEAYPYLTEADARAALLYASELTRAQRRPGNAESAWTPKT